VRFETANLNLQPSPHRWRTNSTSAANVQSTSGATAVEAETGAVLLDEAGNAILKEP
jgi:hypothetical protein